MFTDALREIKAQNLLCRCGQGSEGASYILRQLGFIFLGTGKEGTQFLVGKSMPIALRNQIRNLFESQ